MSVSEPAMRSARGAPLASRVAHGIWSPVLTPLRDDLSIDHHRFVGHARWLLERGCHGLAVFGTTSEANSFSVAERIALLDAALDAGLPADRLMIGTGCCALSDSLALSRHAVASGCHRLLMLPPFYYKAISDEGLSLSYARIIEGVGSSDVRLFFYHFPKLSGVPITVGLIERVRERFPEVVAGVKDSSGDWAHTRALIERFDDLAIFPGTESLLLDGLRAGGAGCITATANVNVAAIRRVFDAWCDDGAGIEALDRSIKSIRRTIEAHPMVPALKHLTADHRHDPAWRTVRPPLLSLSESAGAAVAAALEGEGFQPDYG